MIFQNTRSSCGRGVGDLIGSYCKFVLITSNREEEKEQGHQKNGAGKRVWVETFEKSLGEWG